MTDIRFAPRASACFLCLVLAGCALGPDLVQPKPSAPEDWSSWRSSEAALPAPASSTEAPRPDWWRAFGDPVLDRLQRRALAASPDVRTAALRLAQARVQRHTVAAQRGPEVHANGGATRQRQSEHGAGTRLADAIGGNRAALVEVLSAPFTLYQAGFDASWEPDLWGKVARSVEAAEAGVGAQTALLELARLSLVSELARDYIELRNTQVLIQLAREDVSALEERTRLLQAKVQGGLLDHVDLERQRAELAAVRGQLPGLLARAAASANRIALLLGERPGTLNAELAPRENQDLAELPVLALGLPSEVALRRPDIRAAEASLRRATANIGVARAALYPSIRLGARLGFESYLSGEFADWGSRNWSVGPSLDLPLFDQGRRKSVVRLRELEQQEAAVRYQQTVLKAWQEIDDALKAYSAQQQELGELRTRVHSAAQAWDLAQARYRGGAIDYLAVLDSQRGFLQARRDLATSENGLYARYVTINKAIGNTPPP